MSPVVAFADEVAEVESPTSALHNLEAEQALLGAIISRNEALSKAEHVITAEDFFYPVHQDLYAKILAIRDDGGMLTYTIVKAKLGAYGAHDLGGLTAAAYAARLAAAAAIPNEVVPLAQVVREMAQRRALMHIGTVLKEMAEDDAPIMAAATGAMAAIDEIVASRSDPHTRASSAGDAALASIERMQAAIDAPAGYLPGITSGLSTIDDMTGGFQRGELIILAGRPGMGKSALATTIARLQAEASYNVLLFTLEMTRHYVMDRAIADVVWSERDPISYHDIRRGKVSPSQHQLLADTSRAFRELPLEIDPQGGLTLSQIATRARKHKQKLERQGKLKALAKELNIPVIALAQLNRGVENRDNKRPGMHDLRESGSIEQDADVVLMMFREAYYLDTPTGTHELEMVRLSRLAVVKRRVEVNITKQRSGPTGMVPLFCDIGCNVFRDLDGGAR
jgi:replicative DNA helicase